MEGGWLWPILQPATSRQLRCFGFTFRQRWCRPSLHTVNFQHRARHLIRWVLSAFLPHVWFSPLACNHLAYQRWQPRFFSESSSLFSMVVCYVLSRSTTTGSLFFPLSLFLFLYCGRKKRNINLLWRAKWEEHLPLCWQFTCGIIMASIFALQFSLSLFFHNHNHCTAPDNMMLLFSKEQQINVAMNHIWQRHMWIIDIFILFLFLLFM